MCIAASNGFIWRDVQLVPAQEPDRVLGEQVGKGR